MEDNFFHGLSKMNKPIRFYGLTSMQIFGGAGGSIFWILIMSMSKMSIIGLVFLAIFWILLYHYLIRKLNSEQKKGTPDYFSSLMMIKSTPKAIVDRNHIFSFLINR